MAGILHDHSVSRTTTSATVLAIVLALLITLVIPHRSASATSAAVATSDEPSTAQRSSVVGSVTVLVDTPAIRLVAERLADATVPNRSWLAVSVERTTAPLGAYAFSFTFDASDLVAIGSLGTPACELGPGSAAVCGPLGPSPTTKVAGFHFEGHGGGDLLVKIPLLAPAERSIPFLFTAGLMVDPLGESILFPSVDCIAGTARLVSTREIDRATAETRSGEVDLALDSNRDGHWVFSGLPNTDNYNYSIRIEFVDGSSTTYPLHESCTPGQRFTSWESLANACETFGIDNCAIERCTVKQLRVLSVSDVFDLLRLQDQGVDITCTENHCEIALGGLAGRAIPDLSVFETVVSFILSGNEIENVPAGGWPPQLKKLDLSHNQISEVEAVFPTALEELNLSYNRLDSAPANLSPNLMRLDLSHNQIANLAPEAIQTGATHLDLSHNQIANLAPEAIQTGDGHLDLSHNELESVPSNGIPANLTSLDLSSNQITATTGAFPVLLYSLDLSHNEIAELGDSLPEQLVYLSLAHNQLTRRVDVDAFLWLKRLDLSYNQLTEVPALSDTMQQLDLRGNALSGDLTEFFDAWYGVYRDYRDDNPDDGWVHIDDGPGSNDCVYTTNPDISVQWHFEPLVFECVADLSVAGTVVSPGGEPVIDAEVCMHRADRESDCRRTDAFGRFRFEVGAGNFRLGATDPHGRFAPVDTGWVGLADDPTEPIVLRLAEHLSAADPPLATESTLDPEAANSRSLSGTVASPTGDPLSGLMVCAQQVGPRVPPACVFTDGAGTFAITGLASGNYRISTHHLGTTRIDPRYFGVSANQSATGITLSGGPVGGE